MDNGNLTDKCYNLAQRTIQNGATEAEIILFVSKYLAVNVRRQKVETIERAESLSIGVRVFVGNRQAIVSSSDIKDQSLNQIIGKAISMAKLAPLDPFSRIAKNDEFIRNNLQLDIFDSHIISEEQLIDAAILTEKEAIGHPQITNSDGASAAFSTNHFILANSNGFVKEFASSDASLSVSVIAGSGTDMQRDYDYSSKRYFEDLKDPKILGKRAAMRTIAKLNPTTAPTGEFPVIFDKRVARSLLSNFASAINGANIARGTSFLMEKLNAPVFNKNINIINDPHIFRGIASKPFDAEGLKNSKINLVEDGILRSWLLDIRSANQLNLKSNGCASRGVSSPPSPSNTNLYMQNGEASLEELLADIKSGFFVTETMGMGVNIVTGDYSLGAGGFWIENGEISYPVNGLTIASNLLEMFSSMIPANDLEIEFAINSPSLFLPSMTIAG